MTLTNVDAFSGTADASELLDDQIVATEQVVTEEPTKNPVVRASIQPVTQATETQLALSRTDKREIQRRLDLLGFNTRGIDGVFGNGSRAAIREWQLASDLPASEYLDLNQIAVLRQMSQGKYEVWDARPKRYYDKNGCLREPNGVIVQGRSFRCDLSAASQGLGLSR